LPRCVVIVLLVALALAAPLSVAASRAGAADSDPSDPTTPTTESSTTTTSTSTTTTTTRPDKKADPAKPGVAAPALPVDATPSAGPPELRKAGVLLPDDSVVAATEELTLERAKVELIGSRRAALLRAIATYEKKLTELRASRKHEEGERQQRAIATYRGQSSGWQLGVIVDRGLAEERALYLVAAADAAAREHIRDLVRDEKTMSERLTAARAEKTRVDKQLTDAVDRVNRLLEKLADSSGVITLIDGVLTYVPTGPSPIALLADAADQQLSRLMLTQAARPTDPAWIAARHALATEIAKGKGVAGSTAAAIEASWDATPAPVVHAMLFALRQVGKAYIYATAGPVTFDCSGLTKAAYAQIRLGLPHFSGAQLHLGTPVAPEALRPGDLLTYGPDGAEHVTMYIGDGLVVEAKGRAYGVIVSPMRVDPAKGFAGATRIVP
jgi:cell wall-associated NlpC family hydrolase